MSQMPFKIAFIGSHGVGKTTLCYGLAARLKAMDVSLDFVGEVARRCPLPINRGTTLSAQSWILHTQIAEELVAGERYEVVICDRSVLDNFVYLILAAGSQPSLKELVDHWITTYALLVRVPITEDPTADGLRSTDPVFQRAVHERLGEEIEQRNLEVLDLEGIERRHWIEVVEATVHERLQSGTQLELL
jgi:nicotinamide riboside kinase